MYIYSRKSVVRITFSARWYLDDHVFQGGIHDDYIINGYQYKMRANNI